jgi:hypothetical protein
MPSSPQICKDSLHAFFMNCVTRSPQSFSSHPQYSVISLQHEAGTPHRASKTLPRSRNCWDRLLPRCSFKENSAQTALFTQQRLGESVRI